MKLRFYSLAMLGLSCFLSLSAVADERRTYIVQLNDAPAATYQGGVDGMAPTKPAEGTKLNAQDPAVNAYVNYLTNAQQEVAAAIPNASVLNRYSMVLNGFAASLTDAEVQTLLIDPRVASISHDEPRELNTVSTAGFLGLNTTDGLWFRLSGGSTIKGEGIIIGIVDGGIWPENLAFADRQDTNGKPTYSTEGSLVYSAPPAKWKGGCETVAGIGDPTVRCNNKLIGAKYFNSGFKSSGRVLHWTDFDSSARDSIAGVYGQGGHGTHTSSTAGGNSNNPYIGVNGQTLGLATGMAPRARIAMYKTCWTYINVTATDGSGSQSSCFTSDSVAAIDQAVKDGVDVINFSISGSQNTIDDPVEQAFLRAATAGIFVAASAGNLGPGNQVAHISPWLTTVAVASHDRAPSMATITLGNNVSYTGISSNRVAMPSSSLIRAEDAGLPGADPTKLRQCFSASYNAGVALLDPIKVAGKIVVCGRAGSPLKDKSLAVLQAGGAAVVLVNTANGILIEGDHWLPTLLISLSDGAAVRTYAQTPMPTASLGAAVPVTKPAPIIAPFSSRGPNQADVNVLKPDLAAPGVDVIAGISADLTQTQKDGVAQGTFVPPADFVSKAGTSMASPHVAGVAALLKQAHPDWSPAAIKSALMTTAYATLNDSLSGLQAGTLPFGQGAGHINPNRAVEPGLVYDTSAADWVRYECRLNREAVVNPSDCSNPDIGTLDETYNLNLPSITLGSLTGSAVITRKVTNVGIVAATYQASVVEPAGVSLSVTPLNLYLEPGETKTFTLKITNNTAPEGQWNFGSLTWSDGIHSVKTPVSVNSSKAISAPSLISGVTPSASRLLTLRTGFSGRMTATKGGLKHVTMSDPMNLEPALLAETDLQSACIAGVDTPSVKIYNFDLTADVIIARFALRQEDTVSATDDNNLGLITPEGTWLYSGNKGTNERLDVTKPAVGSYKICVGAIAGGEQMIHQLSSWVVKANDTQGVIGKFTAMLPSQVYYSSTSTVGISWNGLTAGRYLGGVQFKDTSDQVQATTVVEVEVK